MIEDELLALPDVTPSFGERKEIRDGRTVFVPVLTGFDGPLLQSEECGEFVDKAGRRWQVGILEGELVRRLRREAAYAGGCYLLDHLQKAGKLPATIQAELDQQTKAPE